MSSSSQHFSNPAYAIETRIVQAPKDPTGSVVPPIYLSASFNQPGYEVSGEYGYQRSNNPTRATAEAALANVEGAEFALTYATGMAATAAALEIVRPGQTVIFCDQVYGGTYVLAEQILARRGVTIVYADDLNEWTAADMPANLGAILIESPTNPGLRVLDIEHAASLAHGAGAYLFVDNTFCTAYLQRPLELGADAVIYSATKYLGGHSDVLAGVVLANDPALYDHFKLVQREMGNPLSPFDSYSLLRGLKTLAIRMDRAQENTVRIRAFLESHPAIATVYYPGWYSPREAQIHARQSSGDGAVLTFEVADDVDLAVFRENLRLINYAVSLGSVETLLSHPATMTHEDITDEERARTGISERMLRLSVGIEAADDIMGDLDTALQEAVKDVPALGNF
ncbi:trans-sulfuration enzyme family protein [Trueperella sp.]|uniref:trans-sulfuration enzyme family protein n=1 Tax=Trueperella sp. TaxID=2699835 RepID=UPI003736AF06